MDGRIKLCNFQVNISEFIGILNDYLYWYNEKRIKKSLEYLSPIEYRHRLGLVT